VFQDPETFEKFSFSNKWPKAPSVQFFGQSIVNTNGEIWRRQRKIVNPSFYRKNLIKISNTVFVECIKELLDKIHQENGKSVFVPSLMQNVTLEVLGRAGFSFKFDSIKNPSSYIM